MRLKSCTISGFKSLVNLHLPDLGGVNMLVGRNGAGKSAVLQALGTMKPYWSSAVSFMDRHKTHGKPPEESGLEVEVVFTSAELKTAFRDLMKRGKAIVLARQLIDEDWIKSCRFKWDLAGLSVHASIMRDGVDPKSVYARLGWPDRVANFQEILSQQFDEPTANQVFTTAFVDKHTELVEGHGENPLVNLFGLVATPPLHISAYRRSTTTTALGDDKLIESDGRNLIRALFEVQLNRHDVYERIATLVKEILPDAGKPWVRVVGNQLEIVLKDDADQRVQLHDTGGGVEQVLTIATMLCTLPGGILMIEEPENYLHVGAQRRLLKTLKHFQKDFQFFVTTHSSLILDADDDLQVYVLSKNAQGHSEARKLNRKGAFDISTELGLRPSALALSDILLFSEGAHDIAGLRFLIKEHAKLPTHSALGQVNIEVVPLGGNNLINATFDVSLFQKMHPCPLVVIDGEALVRRKTRQDYRDRCLAAGVPCVMLDRHSYENFFPPAILGKYYSAFGAAPIALNNDLPLAGQVPGFNKANNAAVSTMLTPADIAGTTLASVFDELQLIAARILAN